MLLGSLSVCIGALNAWRSQTGSSGLSDPGCQQPLGLLPLKLADDPQSYFQDVSVLTFHILTYSDGCYLAPKKYKIRPVNWASVRFTRTNISTLLQSGSRRAALHSGIGQGHKQENPQTAQASLNFHFFFFQKWQEMQKS